MATVLPSGLGLRYFECRGARVSSSVLTYRAGARDDEVGLGGTAHFLEHMMFKGSKAFGPGEVDRATEEVGGANEAFTAHDLTQYGFSLPVEHWSRALALEADRMAGLALQPAEVEAERRVILEEIAMYKDDPWDALGEAVRATFFPEHPYGRPIIGLPEELEAIGSDALAAFHRRHYRPARSVLVLAGDLGPGEAVREQVERAFGAVVAEPSVDREPLAPPSSLRPGRLVLEEEAEISRLFVAWPAPGAEDPAFAAWRLLSSVLAEGRLARLQRSLVEEAHVATWVGTDLPETAVPGWFTIAVEVAPSVEPERVEDAFFAALAPSPIGAPELARARRILVTDWVLEHERLHDQVLLRAAAIALFDDEHPARFWRRVLAVEADEVGRVLELLGRDRALVGWSLGGGESC